MTDVPVRRGTLDAETDTDRANTMCRYAGRRGPCDTSGASESQGAPRISGKRQKQEEARAARESMAQSTPRIQTSSV